MEACQIGKERVLSAGLSVHIQSEGFATEQTPFTLNIPTGPHRAALQKYIERGTYKFVTVITRKDFKSPCRSGSHNPHQSPHPFRSFRQAFYWH